MENKHYICTGECNGVSDNLGVCGAEDCEKQGQDLKPCDCHDDSHTMKTDSE